MVGEASGQGLKPTWRGLKRGGQQTPVSEFVGLLTEWGTSPGQFGTSVDLHFDRLQVLATDAPFPYPELSLGIKYSDQQNSNWGKFGESAARVLNVDIEYLDIDQLKGQYLHLLRHDNVHFGTNKQGEPIQGTAWEIREIVPPGATVTTLRQAASAPPLPTVTAPLPNPPAPTQVGPVVGVTPEQRALELLHGANLPEFFQKALPDQVIRGDGNLVNLILTGAFVQAMISAGKVTVNEDGTHMVAGMSPPGEEPY